MQSIRFSVSGPLFRTFSRQLCALAILAAPVAAQNAANPQKPTPARIDKHSILVFPDSVITEQWPHTLKLVNAPENLRLLNPGQCIRIGIAATGDGRDDYLEKTQLGFRVQFAGAENNFPLAPFAGTKQIKPEGGDFVTAALAAANVQNPILTMASMGASASRWCVPESAQDGTATIDAEIDSPGGHQKMERIKIPVESFETGSGRAFKNDDELNNFLMLYHYQPDSARIYPALLFMASKNSEARDKILAEMAAYFSAALKSNPDAAKYFTTRITTQTGFARAFGMLGLSMAGYDIDPVLKTMSKEDRQKFTNHPQFPDPYDFSHPEDVATRFDMLWGNFCVTGDLAPIQKIATALAWRSDWDAFDKARKSSNPPKEWTPSIGRGVAYTAAGWSLSSFQRSDPLAADYIEFLIASPETAPEIRSELKGLMDNPAFEQNKN